MREGLLFGRTLLPVVAVARRHGLADTELQRLGIEPERLHALDTMISSRHIYGLLEAIAPRVELESFVIAVATATTPSDVGLLGMALRAAPTVRDALMLLIRYQQVVNTMAGFHLLEREDEVCLVEDRCGPIGLGRAIAAEITVMTTVHWSRLLMGDNVAPRSVAVLRPGRFPGYESWAACRVDSGAPRAAVTMTAALLDRPLSRADDELWRFCGELLAERAGASVAPVVHAIRRQLTSSLCEGTPSLAEVARRLGESPRTLQRRLAAEGQRYTTVLDELRHELALGHLKRGELAIAEIAFALGFDEVASLHRAFRRWEHTTPAAFRAAHAVTRLRG
jgi:AraC-like DNA-binding protein